MVYGKRGGGQTGGRRLIAHARWRLQSGLSAGETLQAISVSISIAFTFRSRERRPIIIASATAPSIRKRAFSLSSLRLPAGSMVATAFAIFQLRTGLLGWRSVRS